MGELNEMLLYFQASKSGSNLTCMNGDSSEVIQANSFSFAPNMIDFSTVFSKFDINAQGLVLSSLLIIVLTTVPVMILAMSLDRKDTFEVNLYLQNISIKAQL